jgi:hypothetical protein
MRAPQCGARYAGAVPFEFVCFSTGRGHCPPLTFQLAYASTVRQTNLDVIAKPWTGDGKALERKI